MPAPEMTALAWRWMVLVFATLGWWGVQPAQTYAADTANCPTQQLDKTTQLTKTTQLIFKKHYPNFVEVRQKTIIKVPEQLGELADDLTFGADTARYRNAMYCLLYGNSASQVMFDKWHPEWRSPSSQVTNDDHLVTVRYESSNLINSAGEFEVGPWLVEVKPGQDWEATLHSPGMPGARRGDAPWESIEVDPGGLEISDASGVSSTSKDSSRKWPSGSPDVEAKLRPPWPLAPSSSAWIGPLGVVSWWIGASVVIAVSARRFIKTVEDPELTTKALARTVLVWALLSSALGVTLILLLHPSVTVNRWRALIGILSGLTLVLLARPRLPSAQGFDGSGLRKRKKAVVSAAAIGLLVILVPGLFSLSPRLMPEASSSPSGIIGLALLDLSMVWLWLTAIVEWSWRFVREGKLGESPGGSEPENSEPPSGSEPEPAIGAALFAVAVVVVACRVLSFHLMWERANWTGKASMRFGTDYRSALIQQLADFASIGPQWAYDYTWVVPGIALVALLHTSSGIKRKTLELERPEKVDLLLVTAIFAIAVVFRGVHFAGSSAAAYGLWLPLNMVVLYATVKVGRRWSVLLRADRGAGENCGVLAELSTQAGYDHLMGTARRCHDLLHQLHLVDRGHAEDTTRDQLERKLRVLHHWRPAGCSHDCLPDEVSVVDVALSLGPRRHWWDNARNAAYRASVVGILPSAVTAWYWNAYGAKHWRFTLNLPTGIPDTVGLFLAQEISYAGAGLVLGALWRLLPGERGPMRAFVLFIAWLVPLGVVVVAATVLGLGLGPGPGEEVLSALLMLMVLTVTSMWIDTDTFRLERHYWPNRLSLLMSIYQVHGLSGQIAYLTAQVGALLTIWTKIRGK